MDYIPVPGVVQVEIMWLWDNQRCQTVLHYKETVMPTVPIMSELCASVVAWFTVGRRGNFANTLQMTEVVCTDLSTQTGPVVNYGVSLPLVGTSASPSVPNNVALVLTKRTALRGRSFRGRIYVPGLCESQVSNNSVPDANFHVSEWSLLKSLASASSPGAWKMHVVSRYAAKEPRGVGISNEVTTLTTDGRIDSMRRRLPGRGS